MSKTHASWLFWILALSYTILWTVLPGLLMPGYLLDVPEMIFVGKEWVIGYPKHPTLHTWILNIFEIVTNRAHFAPFLTSQICVLICFWASWKTARKFFSEEVALLATFSMTAYYYYAYQATEYNNHMPLMAFVSLTIYFLVCAFDENKMKWWFATGFAIGCGLLCKYPMVFLSCSILVFMFVNNRARTFWRYPGPYITILVAFFVFLPNFVWLIQNDFAPIKYAEKHCSGTRYNNIVSILSFCLFNFLLILPTIVSLLPLTTFKWRPRYKSDWSKVGFLLLFTTVIGVFIIFVCVGILKNTNLSTAFGSQIWPLFGVFWAFGIKDNYSKIEKKISISLMVIWVVVMVIIFLIAVFVVPHYKNRPTRFLFPANELAQIAEASWGKYYDSSCKYVTGEWWLASNAAMKMKSNPHVHAYINSDSYDDTAPLSTWSTKDDINNNGGLVFWNLDSEKYENGIPELLFKEYPHAVVLAPISLRYYRTNRQLNIGLAIIPIPETIPKESFPKQKIK
ncbi:MAG: glycosyltransferase family 39 protein [Thermoguttaceae bacterium]